jgi:glycerol transport system ATP-binding protein
MARLELSDVAHSYQRAPGATPDYAVKPLNLTWEDGGAYALLGPSGCGKTTLLGILSGLLRPTSGRVLIDGRDVTPLSPRDRNIAQVFQFPVLYDSMTVFDNLAFPLRNRGMPRRDVDVRVREVAELLELSAELPLRASGLSAELKQRISLGRGLVRKDVSAILLDEPLTVVDPHLKWQLRRKLVQIHRELRVTLIYVTHDQLEALTLADQVVVMSSGEVLQCGTPEALFDRPEHLFVGHFIGSPGMNNLPCTLTADAVLVGGQPVLARPKAADAVPAHGELRLGVRPEFLRLHEEPSQGVPVHVTRLVDLGSSAVIHVQLGPHSLQVKAAAGQRASVGDQRFLQFPEAHAHLYCDGRIVG